MDVYQKHLLRLVVLHIIGTKLQAVVDLPNFKQIRIGLS